MSQATDRQRRQYEGRITTWKDDEGIGFITPVDGGPTVFVHAKSFARRHTRPALDAIVTYHLGANAAGKPRAEDVMLVGAPIAPPRVRRVPAALGVVGALGVLGLCVALRRLIVT